MMQADQQITPQRLSCGRRCQWLLYFWLCNIPLYLAFSSRYLLAADVDLSLHGWGFVILQYLGQFGVMAWIFCFLLPCAACLLPRGRGLRSIAASCAVLGLLYLTIDATVYRVYHYHINAVILRMLFSSAAWDIFSLAWAEWLLAIGILVGGWWLQIRLGAALWKRLQHRSLGVWRGLLLACVPFICLPASHAWHAYADAYGETEITQVADTVPIYFGTTARRLMLAHHWVSEQQLNAMPSHSLGIHHYMRSMRYPKHALQFQDASRHPAYNILIIGIDDVRYDEMTPQVAPHMMQFAAQHAIQFSQHYSGGNCTQPGLFTLFYGIPASYWDSTIHHVTAPLLLQSFQQRGYKAAVFMSAPMVQPPFYKNIFSQVPHLPMTTPGDNSWQRDQRITQETLQFLQQRSARKQHFLGFMFYDAVHGYAYPPQMHLPFTPSNPSLDRLTANNQTDPTPHANAHKNALHFVDGLVQQVLTKVKQLGLLKNTIVIITTDHGEEFNDNKHNYWGHSSNFSAAQTHIPFIIYWPGKKPRQINYRTSHFDVVPTLMQDVLGVTNPISDYAIGHSLWKPGGRDVLLMGSYSFMGLVTPKRILKFYPGGGYQLTDLHMNPASGIDSKALHQAMQWMAQFY